MNKPLYYMWVYSPSTEHVTLAHDEEAPRAHQEYHAELRERRHEDDLVHGYAYRIEGGWRITDWEHKPLKDPRVKRVVVQSILRREGGIKRHGLNRVSYWSEEGKKWAWIEGQQPLIWEDSEHNESWSDSFQRDTPDGDYEDVIIAHFEKLVELALKDPQIQQAVQQFAGVRYQDLDYSDVAAALARSGKKWACGLLVSAGPYEGQSYIEVGVQGPTTTNEDIEQLFGAPVDEEAESDTYGLDTDMWDFPDQSPLKFDEFHYGQPRQDLLSS